MWMRDNTFTWTKPTPKPQPCKKRDVALEYRDSDTCSESTIDELASHVSTVISQMPLFDNVNPPRNHVSASTSILDFNFEKI